MKLVIVVLTKKVPKSIVKIFDSFKVLTFEIWNCFQKWNENYHFYEKWNQHGKHCTNLDWTKKRWLYKIASETHFCICRNNF